MNDPVWTILAPAIRMYGVLPPSSLTKPPRIHAAHVPHTNNSYCSILHRGQKLSGTVKCPIG